MADETIRDAREVDAAVLARLLVLNNAHATELSHLSPERFQRLLSTAWLALAAEDGSALLLAFDHAADYDSPNFLWFREHWPRFAYVDRVVVASHARGRGRARALYGRALSHTAVNGLERLCCEVNLDPPNLASDAFHATLGFAEVGRARLLSGKVVRYLARETEAAA
jgi:predicted GNAT superfamily acetyltransferase